MPDEQFANQVKSYVEKASAAGVSKIGMGRFIEMKYKEHLMDKEAKREDAYREKMLSLQEREMKLKEQSTESAKKSFQLTQVDTDGDGVADTFAKFNPYTGEIIREDIDPALSQASQFDVSTDPAASIEELGQTQPTDPLQGPMAQPGYENGVEGPLTPEAAAYSQPTPSMTPQQRLDQIENTYKKEGVVGLISPTMNQIAQDVASRPGEYISGAAAIPGTVSNPFGAAASNILGRIGRAAPTVLFGEKPSGASGSW